MNTLSLYIHIPFCHKLCPYCGFYKVKTKKDLESAFINALLQELTYYATHYNFHSFHSIFLGGGTPSILSEESLESLFTGISQLIPLSDPCEITIEMNPESISHHIISFLKSININRFSVGVQSFNQTDLTFLGRAHTPEQLVDALTIMHDNNLNYNIDLITGLPHLTIDALSHSIHQALHFKPTHLSTYALSIEPNTPFEKNHITPLDHTIDATHYQWTHDQLKKEGFIHYEVSAFSKPGYQSRHNLTYWKYEPFIGIGPSANSFFNNRRYTQPSNVFHYINNPIPTLPKPLDSQTLIQEFLISNLRLLSGFDIQTFNNRFGIDFESHFQAALSSLQNKGLLSIQNGTCKPTPTGVLLLNEVLLEFI